MTRELRLTPAQQRAAANLIGGLNAGDVLVLEGQAGTGKTTVLHQVQNQTGGKLLGVRDFMAAVAARGPSAVEAAFLAMLDEAVASHNVVFVDDLHLVTRIVEACEDLRSHLLDAALTTVLGEAAALGKKLVFATAGEAPWPIRRRALTWEILDLTEDDYRCLCAWWLDPRSAGRVN